MQVGNTAVPDVAVAACVPYIALGTDFTGSILPEEDGYNSSENINGRDVISSIDVGARILLN
jgi:hypothetical protein